MKVPWLKKKLFVFLCWHWLQFRYLQPSHGANLEILSVGSGELALDSYLPSSIREGLHSSLASLMSPRAPSPSSAPPPLIPYVPPSHSPLIPFESPSNSPFPPLLPFSPPPLLPYGAPAPFVVVNPLPPNLTGHCSLNFSALGATLEKTAADCINPWASLVGDVICCPQLYSLLRISQGEHIMSTGYLGFNSSEAKDCFSDTLELLVTNGANSSISTLCIVQASNLTVGSCPITNRTVFESLVNTTLLLRACQQANNPLKECSNHLCQTAITNAAKLLTLESSKSSAVSDCEAIVESWLAAQIDQGTANQALRSLISCKVNEECPLNFGNTSLVAASCNSPSPSNVSCCNTFQQYVSNNLQEQMLITNLQAYHCAADLGNLLQNQSVTANIYALCGTNLRDFSLQGQGNEGCLLSSLPTDVNRDTSGITFTCDLSDNINAQWPDSATSPASSASQPALTPTPSLGSSLCVGKAIQIFEVLIVLIFSNLLL